MSSKKMFKQMVEDQADTKLIFKNKQNERIVGLTGREHWISRSVAVVGIVTIKYRGTNYILVGKRGKKAADFQGSLNLPCGYLDWDETTKEACEREIFEETNFRLNLIPQAKGSGQLVKVSDNPNNNRQNVTFYYHFKYKTNKKHVFEALQSILSTKNCDEDEVESVFFMNSHSFNLGLKDRFCFNHDKVVAKVFEQDSLVSKILNLLPTYFKSKEPII